MRFLKLLPLLLLSAIILPSCGDDEPRENTQSLTISSSLNYISAIDLTDNSLSLYPGADYGVTVNLDRATLQLFVNNLQYDTDERAISFALPELRMEYTQTGWKLRHPEAIEVQAGASTVSVSDLVVDFVLRVDGSQNLVIINYTLDDRYELTTFFTHNQFIGKTSSADMTDPDKEPFLTEQSRYLVVIDNKTKTAEVQIAYPKFVSNMPSERIGTMVFKNIPLTFTQDGFTFKADKLTPEIKNVPYPDYEITDIKGTVVAGKTIKLSFDCAKFNREVTFDGTAY